MPVGVQSYSMWAGQRVNHGETEPVFCDIGDHPMYAKMHGHSAPVRVVATEDVAGRYWGWLDNTNLDRDAAPVYADFPCMIHEHEGIFSVCFPNGYQIEVDHNAGRVVRLSIVAAEG